MENIHRQKQNQNKNGTIFTDFNQKRVLFVDFIPAHNIEIIIVLR